MNVLNRDKIIEFAQQLEGKNLQTKTGKNFSVEVSDSALIFTPESSNKPRRLSKKNLDTAIQRFSRYSSFSPTLYRPGGLTATYYLPLFKLFLEGAGASRLSTWIDDEAEFEKQRQASAKLSEAARLKRIATSQQQPETYYVLTKAYKRNQHVVEQKLFEARGVCQGCGNEAPFERRIDQQPYLEVHHRVPLSENGTDSLENTIALCPNCHREAHYG